MLSVVLVKRKLKFEIYFVLERICLVLVHFLMYIIKLDSNKAIMSRNGKYMIES